MDPLGLWRVVTTATDNWAVASSDEGDTLGTLADLIKLERSEIGKWAKLSGGRESIRLFDDEPVSLASAGQNDPICAGQDIMIPNTIVMALPHLNWYDFSAANEAQLRCRNLEDYPRSFMVTGRHTLHVNVGTDFNKLISAFNADGIYSFVYGGHGGGGALEVGHSSVGPDAVKPPYKLALIILQACGGADPDQTGQDAQGKILYAYWYKHVSSNGGVLEAKQGWYFF